MVKPLDGASLVKLCGVVLGGGGGGSLGKLPQPLVKRNLGLVECSQLRQLSPISLMSLMNMKRA